MNPRTTLHAFRGLDATRGYANAPVGPGHCLLRVGRYEGCICGVKIDRNPTESGITGSFD